MSRPARLTLETVQLIKDIHVVKCPGAEQTENLVDEGTKKYPLQVGIGP